MHKIIIVASSSLFVIQHLKPIIDLLKDRSNLFLICPFDSQYKLEEDGYKIIYIPIKRNPDLLDFFSFCIFAFHRLIINPNSVLSFTPKGGILNSFTFFCGGKSFHYFTGQRWALYRGIKRKIFKFLDFLIVKLTNCVYCDGISQSEYIATELKIKGPKVIGAGSLSGVDLSLYNSLNLNPYENLFNKNKFLSENFKKLLLEKKIENKNFLYGFVGRIAKDKGIFELLLAFKQHVKYYPDSYLIIIGFNEIGKEFIDKIKHVNNTVFLGFQSDIHLYLNCFDTFVLPSHREGFGTVILEAAACSVPIIATNINGPKDFVKHKVNGYLVEPRDVKSLKNGLDYFRDNPFVIKTFTIKALELVTLKYNKDYVSKLFVNDFLSQ
jgi:glycosyltransferase involved in cell wall biosynthesis